MMGGWQSLLARRSPAAFILGAGASARCAAVVDRLQLFRHRRAAAPDRVSTPAALDPINGLIATTRLHLLRLDAAIAADQADAARLTPLRDDRQAQLTALEAEFARIEPATSTAAASASDAAPTTGAVALPDTPEAIISAVRGDAATAQVQFTDATSSASRYRAAMLRLDRRHRWPATGRCWHDQSHAHPHARPTTHPSVDRGVRGSGGESRRPARSSARPRPPRRPARWPRTRSRAAIRAGRRAGRGLGLRPGRRLRPGSGGDDRRRPVRTSAAPGRHRRPAHRRAAPTAPEPAAAYQVSVAVTDAESALQLAQDIETDAAAAWRVVIGSTDDAELRGFALTGLSDAAVRLAMWKQVVRRRPRRPSRSPAMV